MQLYMARVGYDSKIWKVLAESKTPLSVAQIAEKTAFNPILLSTSNCKVSFRLLMLDYLERVLRYYQSFRMVAQPADDEYVANNVTKALAGPDGIASEYL